MNMPVRQANALAVTSLIAGLLGWTMLPLLGSIVAIVTGHMARGEIRRQPDRYEGDGMAIAGLVLGYAALAGAILLVLAFILFFGGIAWLSTMGA